MIGRSIGASLGSLAISLFSTAASAQEAPAAETQSEISGFEDIVVTAQKRSQNLQDVPFALSVVGGDELSTRGISDITQLQSLAPNVNIQQRTSFGVVTIRGVGFDILTAGAESGVAVHLDGTYIARPAAGLAGLYDIERVEVARGPQGTLYGRNATGGAINIITRQPTDVMEGYVSIGYGNYDHIAAEGAIGGPIAEGISFRVAAKLEDRSGFGTNLFNGRDVDDLNTSAIRGQLKLEPASNVTLKLSVDYFRENDSAFVFHYGGPIAGCRAPGIPGTISPPATSYLPTCGVLIGGQASSDIRDVNNDGHPRNEREFYGVSAIGEVDLGAVTLRSISAWRGGSSYFLSDLDGTSAYIVNVTYEEDQDQYSQEIQLVGSTGPVEWIVGGYYFYESNFGGSRGVFGPNIGRVLIQQTGRLNTNAYAVFGQATVKLNEWLSLTAGARYSSERKTIRSEEATANTLPATPRPTTLPDEITFNSFTPKFGIELRPADRVLIFASAQKGFKSGGFSLGSLAPPYEPETIWSYEAGVRATLLPGLRANLTAFHYDYSDLQQGRVEGTATIIRNAANAKVDGIELEVDARVGSASFDLAAAWLDARFTDYKTTDPARFALGPQDLAGNRLSNAPRYTLSMGAQNTWDTVGGELTIRGEVYLQGKAYFSPFNLEADSQKSYAITNLFLNYERSDGWNVGIYARNLTNELASAGGFVSSALVGSISTRALVPPRTYGIRIGKKF